MEIPKSYLPVHEASWLAAEAAEVGEKVAAIGG
jgi:hypothetical protein